jgi:hypothetical protein
LLCEQTNRSEACPEIGRPPTARLDVFFYSAAPRDGNETSCRTNLPHKFNDAQERLPKF